MTKPLKYDVAIVGTGPAGMFAALKLVALCPDISIIMYEKGRRRIGSSEDLDGIMGNCCGEPIPESITEGWGGAGAASDGKYNLDETGRVGGRLVTGGYVPREKYVELLHEAADLYVQFGGDDKRLFGKISPDDHASLKRLMELRRLAAAQRMELHTFPVLHLGTSNARKIVENIRDHLSSAGVDIVDDTMVTDFVQHRSGGWMIKSDKNNDVVAKKVIICPGRSGATWFRQWADKAGLTLHNNGIDIGVRVECSQVIMSELTDLLYEAKVYYRAPNDDPWRTFCMCPRGRVAVEEYQDTGMLLANGHTDNANLTENCNFAILGTQTFTRPFKDPLKYASQVAESVNDLAGGNGIIVQRLGDMLRGRRSTERRLAKGMVRPTCLNGKVVPGDLRLAIPGRFTWGIPRFLEALSAIAPGVANPDTLLYGAEIKLHMSRVEADPTRGFEIRNRLHVAGDGVGYTRGLNGASVHGMLVAEWIAKHFDD